MIPNIVQTLKNLHDQKKSTYFLCKEKNVFNMKKDL